MPLPDSCQQLVGAVLNDTIRDWPNNSRSIPLHGVRYSAGGVSASAPRKYWSDFTSNLVRVLLGEIPEALSEILEPYRWSGG